MIYTENSEYDTFLTGFYHVGAVIVASCCLDKTKTVRAYILANTAHTGDKHMYRVSAKIASREVSCNILYWSKEDRPC